MKKFTNSFKYKCEALSCYVCFNKLKVDDSIHVKMLMVKEMRFFLLNHSNIIVKYWVACILVYYNKCKMQFVNNDFNILKVNGSILIIEEIWRKSLIHSNINVWFKILTCVFDKLW